MMYRFVIVAVPDHRGLGQGIAEKRALVRVSVNSAVIALGQFLGTCSQVWLEWNPELYRIIAMWKGVEIGRRSPWAVSSPYPFLLGPLGFLTQALLQSLAVEGRATYHLLSLQNAWTRSGCA